MKISFDDTLHVKGSSQVIHQLDPRFLMAALKLGEAVYTLFTTTDKEFLKFVEVLQFRFETSDTGIGSVIVRAVLKSPLLTMKLDLPKVERRWELGYLIRESLERQIADAIRQTIVDARSQFIEMAAALEP